MLILHDILGKLKNEFTHSAKGDERGTWFVYTLVAIIIPFASSKTSNLLRFAFSDVRRLIAQAALDDNFDKLFPAPRKSVVNSLVAALLRIAA